MKPNSNSHGNKKKANGNAPFSSEKFKRDDESVASSSKPKRKARSALNVFEADEEKSQIERNPRRFDAEALRSYEYELPEQFDDEEIEEDDAFDDDDLEKYGDVGAGSSDSGKKKKKKQKKGTNAAESKDKKGKAAKGRRKATEADDEEAAEHEDANDEEEEEDIGDMAGQGDLVDLSDLLGDDSSSSKPKGKSKGKAKSREPEGDSDDGGSEGPEEIDDGDDEEAHQNMLRLLQGLDGKSSKKGGARKSQRVAEQSEVVAESEFNIGSEDTSSAGSGLKLSLADLVSPLKAESGYAGLKKKLSTLADEKNAGLLSEPLHDIRQEELERKIGYVESKKDLDKWQPLVKRNREAEHLVFPLVQQPRESLSAAALTSKFQPTTDFEKDLNAILQDLDQQEKQLSKAEEAELADRNLSPEELEARRAELLKMKKLLFFHELKAAQMNKIKSKSYRRLRKKMKEKNKLSIEELEKIDPELAKQEKEKMALKAAKERMTLKHKNMSKWVKRNLNRGKFALDAEPDTRKAIAEQLRIGEKLRQKVRSANSGSESDQEDQDNDDWDSDLESDEDVKNAKREERDKKLSDQLAALANELESGPVGQESEAPSGLFALKFMQRAAEKKKQKALEDMKELEERQQAELEDEEVTKVDGDKKTQSKSKGKAKAKKGESEEEIIKEISGRRKLTIASVLGKSAELPEADAEDTATNFVGNSLQVPTVGHSVSSSVRVAQPLTVNSKLPTASSDPLFAFVDFDDDVAAAPSTDAAAPSAPETEPAAKPGAKRQRAAAESESQPAPAAKSSKRKKTTEPAPAESGDAEADQSNPWAQDTSNARKARRAVTQQTAEAEKKSALIDPNAPLLLVTESASEKSAQLSKTAPKLAKASAAAAKQEQKDASKSTNASKSKSKSVKSDPAPSMAGADTAPSKTSSKSKSKSAETDDADDDGAALAEIDAAVEDSVQAGHVPAVDLLSGDKHSVQARLVAEAFANDSDLAADFAAEKQRLAEEGLPKPDPTKAVMPGWGAWGGVGVKAHKPKPSAKGGDKGKGVVKKPAESTTKAPPRKDDGLSHVIINEKRDKKVSKYMIQKIPHPFTSREQYEQSMRNPLGPDWNALSVHHAAIRPAVSTRAGAIIEPITFQANVKPQEVSLVAKTKIGARTGDKELKRRHGLSQPAAAAKGPSQKRRKPSAPKEGTKAKI